MFAVGVLSFIFVDVLSNAGTILENTLLGVKHRHHSVAYLVWLVVLLAAGFAAGSAGLAMLEKRLRPLGARTPPIAGGAGTAAVAPSEADALALEAQSPQQAGNTWAGVDRALTDAVPLVPLVVGTNAVLLSPRVRHYEADVIGPLWDQVWLK